jgi:hypothetical protein
VNVPTGSLFGRLTRLRNVSEAKPRVKFVISGNTFGRGGGTMACSVTEINSCRMYFIFVVPCVVTLFLK